MACIAPLCAAALPLPSRPWARRAAFASRWSRTWVAWRVYARRSPRRRPWSRHRGRRAAASTHPRPAHTVGAVLHPDCAATARPAGPVRLLRRARALWLPAVAPVQRRFLPANSTARRLAAGVLWGWLPCGLSATVLIAAWLQARASQGALTMFAFGLGTLPVMVPLTWSGARLGQWLQRGAWRTASAALVLAAGATTLSAPWLMQAPTAHRLLAAIGCGALHP